MYFGGRGGGGEGGREGERERESEVCHISILINIVRNKNLNNQILSQKNDFMNRLLKNYFNSII